jgi:hypothetical protein
VLDAVNGLHAAGRVMKRKVAGNDADGTGSSSSNSS